MEGLLVFIALVLAIALAIAIAPFVLPILGFILTALLIILALFVGFKLIKAILNGTKQLLQTTLSTVKTKEFWFMMAKILFWIFVVLAIIVIQVAL